MKKSILSLCLAVLLGALLCLPALAQESGMTVTLPADYETSGRFYPVVYLLPEDGYAADDSGIRGKLEEVFANGTGTQMIVVQPAFEAGGDVLADLKALIAQIDGEYRTLAKKENRVLLGSGAGGYLAYALGLELKDEVGAMVSIRGSFTEENNPWFAVYGDVYDKLDEQNAADPEYLNGVYTYMDAPVDDAYTNQAHGTNDLGSLFIGFGTGSAAHEFTVRPGAYDDAFVTESVSRVVNRLTARMLGGAASGTLALESAALSAQDAQVSVTYSVNLSDAFAAFAPGETAVEVVISVVDPATGEVLAQTAKEHTASGAGVIGGEAAVDNKVNGTSATVKLSAKMLGTTLNLASATLIRVQDMVLDGDVQKIDLMGDWYFNYTGMEKIDVAALTKEEYTKWAVAQPGITSWTKGFGNISDENVTSGYGPDYFNYFIIGSGYYAKTFEVPAEFDSQELILSVGYVDDRCEVYVNGTRVGATGLDERGEPTGDTTWAVYSYFEIDPSLIVRGGENTVVVRAWNDLPFGAGGWYGGPTALYSKAAFELENGTGESDRFYEESFVSAYAASALGKTGTIENNYLIYLPQDYYESERAYPTVYLLHQFNSDHTSYRGDKVNQHFDAGAAAGLFDDMIVVIPNSSEESWWTGDWEKMITDELIPLIDGKYRTIRDARYRLTAGCSMGGQGAMAVALRNPDAFCGAVSFFGAFSYGGASSPNAIASVESKEYMDSFSLYFICGNQDSYGFGVPAIELHQQLEAMGVNHGFFIENGGHDSSFYIPYFDDAFAYIRADMYKSDDAVESLVAGSLTLSGTHVTADFSALSGIEAYLYTVEHSSYTRNPSPALSIPLKVEILQDGEVVHTHTAADHAVMGATTSAISLDAAEYIDSEKPVQVRFTASVFDRVVTLAEIK